MTIDWTPFSLTHVEYPRDDPLGKILAISSLTPMGLICGFIALILFRRDLHTITFFTGLLLNEVLNMLLKYSIRQARPLQRQVNYTEFGMPSSHSQLMWFFACYSSLFVVFRLHQSYPGGIGKGKTTQILHKFGIIAFVCASAAVVTYSRIYLLYHTWGQILWGGLIGCVSASLWFVLTQSVFTPLFRDVEKWPICEYLLIRDTTPVRNVLWFEYVNCRQEGVRGRSNLGKL